MKTGVTVSKTHKYLSTIATLTGSVAIIGLSAAFLTNDFDSMLRAPSLSIGNNNAIAALEPIRSDPASEQDSHKDDIDDPDMPVMGDDNNTDIPAFGNSDVSTDEAESESSDSDPDHITHESEVNEPPQINISMEAIGFLPNSCEYVDKNAAYNILKKYVAVFDAYFNKYPDGQIYLVGCIAKTADWYLTDTELSEKRAETVRQSFIKLGVDGDKLVAIGIGVSDPWRSDEWSNGYFDEETAKNNRRVWVIPDELESQVGIIFSIDAMIDDAKSRE